MNPNLKYFSLFVLLLAMACKDFKPSSKNVPTISEDGVNAVIEIPAGSNHKIEFDKSSNSFEVDQLDGKDRIIDFLPYPANYGFIPSTLMDEERGGDGDALDILVIAESLETGTKLAVQPIAALLLEDNGELDTKIIAVPVDSFLNVIDAKDFSSFTVEYNAAQSIIQDWFLNYKGVGKTKMIGWRNERYAMMEIEKWKE